MMKDFILDADPIIPTGVPATPVEVGIMVINDILPANLIDKVTSEQQPTPEDLGHAAVISSMRTDEAVAKLESEGLTVILPDSAGE